MRSPAGRWASASSTTSPSQPATPRPSSASSASRSSTGTSTTETARRTLSGRTTACSSSSLHEWPFYPGSGGPTDQADTTLNIPMSAGSGDEEYLHAFDHTVFPAVERFRPDLLIVSAGFDCSHRRPDGQHRRHRRGVRELARRARGLAPRLRSSARGRLRAAATLPTLDRALPRPTVFEELRHADERDADHRVARDERDELAPRSTPSRPGRAARDHEVADVSRRVDDAHLDVARRSTPNSRSTPRGSETARERYGRLLYQSGGGPSSALG